MIWNASDDNKPIWIQQACTFVRVTKKSNTVRRRRTRTHYFVLVWRLGCTRTKVWGKIAMCTTVWTPLKPEHHQALFNWYANILATKDRLSNLTYCLLTILLFRRSQWHIPPLPQRSPSQSWMAKLPKCTEVAAFAWQTTSSPCGVEMCPSLA